MMTSNHRKFHGSLWYVSRKIQMFGNIGMHTLVDGKKDGWADGQTARKANIDYNFTAASHE